MYNVGDIFELNGVQFVVKRCIVENLYYMNLVNCPSNRMEANDKIVKFIQDSFGISGGMSQLVAYIKQRTSDIEFAYTGNWESPDFSSLEMLNLFIKYLKRLILVRKIKLLN